MTPAFAGDPRVSTPPHSASTDDSPETRSVLQPQRQVRRTHSPEGTSVPDYPGSHAAAPGQPVASGQPATPGQPSGSGRSDVPSQPNDNLESDEDVSDFDDDFESDGDDGDDGDDDDTLIRLQTELPANNSLAALILSEPKLCLNIDEEKINATFITADKAKRVFDARYPEVERNIAREWIEKLMTKVILEHGDRWKPSVREDEWKTSEMTSLDLEKFPLIKCFYAAAPVWRGHVLLPEKKKGSIVPRDGIKHQTSPDAALDSDGVRADEPISDATKQMVRAFITAAFDQQYLAPNSKLMRSELMDMVTRHSETRTLTEATYSLSTACQTSEQYKFGPFNDNPKIEKKVKVPAHLNRSMTKLNSTVPAFNALHGGKGVIDNSSALGRYSMARHVVTKTGFVATTDKSMIDIGNRNRRDVFIAGTALTQYPGPHPGLSPMLTSLNIDTRTYVYEMRLRDAIHLSQIKFAPPLDATIAALRAAPIELGGGVRHPFLITESGFAFKEPDEFNEVMPHPIFANWPPESTERDNVQYVIVVDDALHTNHEKMRRFRVFVPDAADSEVLNPLADDADPHILLRSVDELSGRVKFAVGGQLSVALFNAVKRGVADPAFARHPQAKDALKHAMYALAAIDFFHTQITQREGGVPAAKVLLKIGLATGMIKWSSYSKWCVKDAFSPLIHAFLKVVSVSMRSRNTDGIRALPWESVGRFASTVNDIVHTGQQVVFMVRKSFPNLVNNPVPDHDPKELRIELVMMRGSRWGMTERPRGMKSQFATIRLNFACDPDPHPSEQRVIVICEMVGSKLHPENMCALVDVPGSDAQEVLRAFFFSPGDVLEGQYDDDTILNRAKASARDEDAAAWDENNTAACMIGKRLLASNKNYDSLEHPDLKVHQDFVHNVVYDAMDQTVSTVDKSNDQPNVQPKGLKCTDAAELLTGDHAVFLKGVETFKNLPSVIRNLLERKKYDVRNASIYINVPFADRLPDVAVDEMIEGGNQPNAICVKAMRSPEASAIALALAAAVPAAGDGTGPATGDGAGPAAGARPATGATPWGLPSLCFPDNDLGTKCVKLMLAIARYGTAEYGGYGYQAEARNHKRYASIALALAAIMELVGMGEFSSDEELIFPNDNSGDNSGHNPNGNDSDVSPSTPKKLVFDNGKDKEVQSSVSVSADDTEKKAHVIFRASNKTQGYGWQELRVNQCVSDLARDFNVKTLEVYVMHGVKGRRHIEQFENETTYHATYVREQQQEGPDMFPMVVANDIVLASEEHQQGPRNFKVNDKIPALKWKETVEQMNGWVVVPSASRIANPGVVEALQQAAREHQTKTYVWDVHHSLDPTLYREGELPAETANAMCRVLLDRSGCVKIDNERVAIVLRAVALGALIWRVAMDFRRPIWCAPGDEAMEEGDNPGD